MAHYIRDIFLLLQSWFSSAKIGDKGVAKDIDADGLADKSSKDRTHTLAEIRLCHRRSVLVTEEPATRIEFEPVTKDLLKGLG